MPITINDCEKCKTSEYLEIEVVDTMGSAYHRTRKAPRIRCRNCERVSKLAMPHIWTIGLWNDDNPTNRFP